MSKTRPAPNIDIRPDHWAIVQAILQKHVPQYAVWAFGSRAKWSAKEYSDLDLAVITDEPLSLDVSASLNDDFSESDLPWKVDVVDWATTSASFRKIIERDKVVVQEGNKSLGMVGEWTEDRFGRLVRFVTEKSPAKDTNIDTYVSTENMLADFGGIASASSLPLTGNVTKFKVGDTLFSNIRTYFKKVWQAKFDGCCSNDVLVLRPENSEVLLADYLHQICRWEKLTELSIRTSKGAKMPRGDKDALADFKFQLPPLPEQRAIAHILGTLDDKIELNRKQNETLEAMARALFKAWFVDFEPVCAKMEGRWQRGQSLPGLPAHLYDLFPDRLVESELGEIPEGWEVEPLVSSINFKEGPGIRNWQYTNSDKGIRFINIRCIQGGDLHLNSANRITEEEANGKYAQFHLQPWDIVVSTSGTLGRSAIVRAEHLPLVLNTSVIRFRPVEGKTSFSYLYRYLNGSDFLERLETMASGSVQRNFGPMHLKQIKLLLPSFDLMRIYEDICRPIYEQIVSNRSQSSSLAQLRDTLLPKLISGELRVPDAETLLKERFS